MPAVASTLDNGASVVVPVMNPSVAIYKANLFECFAYRREWVGRALHARSGELLKDVRRTSVDVPIELVLKTVAPEAHQEAGHRVGMAAPQARECPRLGVLEERPFNLEPSPGHQEPSSLAPTDATWARRDARLYGP